MAQQKSSSGCVAAFLGMFAALGIFGMVVVGCICVACIGVLILIGASAGANQDKIESLNNGRGTQANPVDANEWLQFNTADVRVVQIQKPANDQIEAFSSINNPPAAGSDYVLVRFEVRCKQAKCNAFSSGFWLVDETGEEWGEPTILFLEDDLNRKDAVRGAVMSGWQAFEFPQNARLDLVKIRWDSATLYSRVP